MSADVVYLDSSAIVKLVIDEPESAALRRHLRSRRTASGSWVASALVRTEVVRAVLDLGDEVIDQARTVLSTIHLTAVSDRTLADASILWPAGMRSLDAIHLAAAKRFGSELRELVTYDHRLADAAEEHGIAVSMPGTGRRRG